MTPLTPRELDVLSLTWRGLEPQEIADFLGISRSSVRVYLARANRKLESYE